MENILRILIADDQALFADNLKTVLETRAGDIQVAAVARDGAQAVHLARETKPDIILMDVCMPNLDGVLAAQVIKREQPRVKIIMLTTFDDDEYVMDALTYGAIGYLLKDISMDELINVIRTVGSGSMVIAPSVAGNLIKNLNKLNCAPEKQERPHPPSWLSSLNAKEKQIIALMIHGCNNYDIGSRLSIREQTVKNYVSAIYEKMGIHDRYMVIREAEPFADLLDTPIP